MNSEVRIKNEEEQSSDVGFEDLVEGDGVQIKGKANNMNGLRLRISYTHYLHFDLRGKAYLNEASFWPEGVKEPVKRFKLIAEEI